MEIILITKFYVLAKKNKKKNNPHCIKLLTFWNSNETTYVHVGTSDFSSGLQIRDVSYSTITNLFTLPISDLSLHDFPNSLLTVQYSILAALNAASISVTLGRKKNH